mgnify:CR=1 FL=1
MSNKTDNSKIAIIGSGISGLACGYFLADHYQIKLYEKNDYLGGHSNTVDINYNRSRGSLGLLEGVNHIC